MLNNIRRAAPSVGKIVGKGKYAGVLWLLNPDRDTYYQIREAKTKAYAAKRAKLEKAERRKRQRYGNAAFFPKNPSLRHCSTIGFASAISSGCAAR